MSKEVVKDRNLCTLHPYKIQFIYLNRSYHSKQVVLGSNVAYKADSNNIISTWNASMCSTTVEFYFLLRHCSSQEETTGSWNLLTNAELSLFLSLWLLYEMKVVIVWAEDSRFTAQDVCQSTADLLFKLRLQVHSNYFFFERWLILLNQEQHLPKNRERYI